MRSVFIVLISILFLFNVCLFSFSFSCAWKCKTYTYINIAIPHQVGVLYWKIIDIYEKMKSEEGNFNKEKRMPTEQELIKQISWSISLTKAVIKSLNFQ